jgi:TolB protein
VKSRRYGSAAILGCGLAVAGLACGCSNRGPNNSVPAPGYPFIDRFPTWSPDGLNILYEHRGIVEILDGGVTTVDPDSAGLWLVKVDGTDPRIVVRATSIYGDWSPDGQWIAYEVGAQVYKAQLAGRELDTTSVVQLTSRERNFFPSWSPDGAWIAYDSDLSAPQAPYEVWKMRSDGTEKTNISNFSARMPDWSPDGRWIVHVRYVDADGEIFTMDASGNSLTQLTFNRRFVMHPRYSPDGTLIVYQSDGEIWVMSSDGSSPRRLVEGHEPSWSPDRKSIAFVRPSIDPKNNGTIWVICPDGSGLKQLTSGLR